MYILSLRPWRFISGPRRESISGLITLIMIRGTDARTVTDIPTGKQLHIIAFQIFSLFLMRDPVGVMEGWSVAKYQIPSTKLQTNHKFQYQMTKTVLEFVICYLEFLASIGLLPAFPVDQMEIAAIDENTGALSQDKHRITPVYGITE